MKERNFIISLKLICDCYSIRVLHDTTSSLEKSQNSAIFRKEDLYLYAFAIHR